MKLTLQIKLLPTDTQAAMLKGNNKMYDDDYMDLGGKEYQLLCDVNEYFFNLSMSVSDIVNCQNNNKNV